MNEEHAVAFQNERSHSMESLLGMLIGAGLFVGGFSLHDVNYRQDYRGNNTVVLHSEGQEYLIPRSNFASPDRENLAYLMGPVGAALFALSAKHAWDQREKRRAAVSVHLDQSFERLRVRLGQERSSGASGFRLQHLPKAVQTVPFTSLSASGTSGIYVALAPSALIFFYKDAKRTFAQNPNIWRLKP